MRKALEASPDYPEATYSLGVILSARGQEGEATEQFRRAVKLNPNYADAHYALGFVLEQNGQTQKAIAEYKEALRLDPENARNQAKLADTLRRLSPGN